MQEDVTLWFKLGDWVMELVVTYLYTFVSAGSDGVMLQLYLRYYFYNQLSK